MLYAKTFHTRFNTFQHACGQLKLKLLVKFAHKYWSRRAPGTMLWSRKMLQGLFSTIEQGLKIKYNCRPSCLLWR